MRPKEGRSDTGRSDTGRSDTARAGAGRGEGNQRRGRIPPQAVDVEMAVLGAMLLQPEATVSNVFSLLTRDAFYSEAHRTIFDAIVDLFEKQQPIDLITVGDVLRRGEQLEGVGGLYYLTEMTNEVVSPAHVEYHCRIVLEKAIKRSLIEISTGIVSDAYLDSADAFELIDEAEEKIFSLSDSYIKQSFTEVRHIVKPLMDRIWNILQDHTGVTGVPSGYDLLDIKTGGWQPTDLIILAARPSMGKTALALSMARNAAIDADIPIGFFSLEMSSEQLALRLLCAEARVNMQLVRTGRIKEEDHNRLARYVGKLERARMFIDDTPGISILELRAKARRMVHEHGVGLIFIDYLQLMTAPSVRESREREIATISRSLKGLAKDLKVPVIALSQLNRSVEQRTGGKPMLADLRESGSIEQDADVVMFIHRAKDQDTPPEDQGKATVIISKQRNGEIGEVELAWIADYARFENLENRFPIMALPPPEEEATF
ncbi:MAG: replicative DNA helicase [Bacteroidetes bacterium]|nr:replicative DNA helicase [Bacteroidota bacterium]